MCQSSTNMPSTEACSLSQWILTAPFACIVIHIHSVESCKFMLFFLKFTLWSTWIYLEIFVNQCWNQRASKFKFLASFTGGQMERFGSPWKILQAEKRWNTRGMLKTKDTKITLSPVVLSAVCLTFFFLRLTPKSGLVWISIALGGHAQLWTTRYSGQREISWCRVKHCWNCIKVRQKVTDIRWQAWKNSRKVRGWNLKSMCPGCRNLWTQPFPSQRPKHATLVNSLSLSFHFPPSSLFGMPFFFDRFRGTSYHAFSVKLTWAVLTFMNSLIRIFSWQFIHFSILVCALEYRVYTTQWRL